MAKENEEDRFFQVENLLVDGIPCIRFDWTFKKRPSSCISETAETEDLNLWFKDDLNYLVLNGQGVSENIDPTLVTVLTESDLLEIWGERKQSIVLRFPSESLCSNVAFFIRNFSQYRYQQSIHFFSRELNKINKETISTDEASQYVGLLGISTSKWEGPELNVLDFMNFVENMFYSQVDENEILVDIFQKYSRQIQSKKGMTEGDLRRFLEEHQKMENVTVDMLENILIRFHKIDYDHDTFPFLIYSEFVEFLYSGEFNSVLKDEERSVESQHATLSEYYISSAYILDNQNRITVESFKSLLLLGAKCIDLEIWDSKEGPHVRLEKMVKPLDLLEVLESINKYAFIISDMPLIISLRIHCNQTNQGRLAQMLTSVFKQKLLKAPGKERKPQTRLPSLYSLKNRIILQGEKNLILSSEPDIKARALEMKNNGWRGVTVEMNKTELRIKEDLNPLSILYPYPWFAGEMAVSRAQSYIYQTEEHLESGQFAIHSFHGDIFLILLDSRQDERKVVSLRIIQNNKKLFLEPAIKFDDVFGLIDHYSIKSFP
ncbi:1-phosphatidylinositol 4,5-bisphosphate phosphodiesterase delta-4 [Eurytemora carolleeae]|uniref:1-phosphatidylinositol 4,5-bisphosphate phosphodiesterase delta-4 n=1 Tax=Eurytemora carolleeae TaxID=1294199 RepID=UPI000C771F00|nr:1-phosphatidylinositol 4,5-bisphosphate phosphodiesterase delta-4 [Eurytemora carolleeae]|eukprot:XP_023324288.1 1-phosphatidylinositol 4,5-bisphosphate phosphodiesterase delta-4-like [Eurytemora affinis]